MEEEKNVVWVKPGRMLARSYPPGTIIKYLPTRQWNEVPKKTEKHKKKENKQKKEKMKVRRRRSTTVETDEIIGDGLPGPVMCVDEAEFEDDSPETMARIQSWLNTSTM